MSAMPKCGDCAFLPGSDASNSPNTLVKAHLSALTGEVFECHLVPGPCKGWVEAVRLRKISPMKPTETQIEIAATSVRIMDHMERLAMADQEKHGR